MIHEWLGVIQDGFRRIRGRLTEMAEWIGTRCGIRVTWRTASGRPPGLALAQEAKVQHDAGDFLIVGSGALRPLYPARRHGGRALDAGGAA